MLLQNQSEDSFLVDKTTVHEPASPVGTPLNMFLLVVRTVEKAVNPQINGTTVVSRCSEARPQGSPDRFLTPGVLARRMVSLQLAPLPQLQKVQSKQHPRSNVADLRPSLSLQ